MIKNIKKKLIITSIVSTIVLTACSGSNSNDEQNNKATEEETAVNYSEAVDYTITGIEPGAGITVTTEKAIEEYDNLKGWTQEESSTAAMTAELDKAIENEEPIIITGWTPHWKFTKHPTMKFLDDPKEVYGSEEKLHTLTRMGFEEDKPEAYKLISQFKWDAEDMESIMFESKETGDEIDEVAKRWVAENEEKVSEWTKSVADVDGVEIEFASTPWDSDRAASEVLKEVMEQKGFDVKITTVDVAIVFESIATGDADVTLGAELPITHQAFYENHEDEVVDLGPNLEGAKIGLVVPEYMDIDSIEDLEPNN